jgi:hypothetical protein
MAQRNNRQQGRGGEPHGRDWNTRDPNTGRYGGGQGRDERERGGPYREELGGNLSGAGEGYSDDDRYWTRGQEGQFGGEGGGRNSWYGREWQGGGRPQSRLSGASVGRENWPAEQWRDRDRIDEMRGQHGVSQFGGRSSGERYRGGYERGPFGGNEPNDSGRAWEGGQYGSYGGGRYAQELYGRDQSAGPRTGFDSSGMSGGGAGQGGWSTRDEWSGGRWGNGGQRRGFAGRGPKGYQRSDERIKEQVSDALMDDDDVDASEISIEVSQGEVTLTGTVSSREEKRAAEDAVEHVSGVREVINQLRVKPFDPNTTSVPQGRGGSTAGSQGQSTSGGRSSSRGAERET